MKTFNIAFAAFIALSASQAFADNYYDRSDDRARYDIDREKDALDRERYDLERDKIAAERARIDAERNNLSNNATANSPASCPAGFSRSENKCSNAERKHGCKDIRLSNGMGCVSR